MQPVQHGLDPLQKIIVGDAGGTGVLGDKPVAGTVSVWDSIQQNARGRRRF